MVVPARRYRPAAFEAKACSAQVLIFGAIKPPTAPLEFTSAIPPAAAAPTKARDLGVQDRACHGRAAGSLESGAGVSKRTALTSGPEPSTRPIGLESVLVWHMYC